MKIIGITVEGYSEQKFCNGLLRDYVYQRTQNDIYATPVLTNSKLRTRGGNVNWAKLKFQIETKLKQNPAQIQTMMFDLYALDSSFPGYNNALKGLEKAAQIEQAIAKELNTPNFIPYIQVHEFETLLFSNPQIMNQKLRLNSGKDLDFEAELVGLNNPEELNDGQATAPSKRILKQYRGYEKVDDGFLLAQEIGIEQMRQSCPHFNEWVTKLLAI